MLFCLAQGVHTVLKRVLPSFVTDGGDAAASNTVIAPMTGTVVKVMVKPGDAVKKGDAVAIMEAMKMEVSSGVGWGVDARRGRGEEMGARLIDRFHSQHQPQPRPNTQLVLRAPADGIVAQVNAAVNDQVAEATPLIVMEDEEEAAAA